MSQQPKGASPLQLDEYELRRELIRANTIIAQATGLLTAADKEALNLQLIDSRVTDSNDPVAQKKRYQAINRITPKRDYLKILLLVLCGAFGTAWYLSQTENELLRSEIVIYIQGESSWQTPPNVL